MSKSNSQVTSIDDAPAAEVQAKPATVVVGNNSDDQLSGERKTITIYASEGDGGSEAVSVSINGYAYQIPRGVPCNVPVEVISVLDNAQTTLLTGAAGGAINERVIPRFQYRVTE